MSVVEGSMPAGQRCREVGAQPVPGHSKGEKVIK